MIRRLAAALALVAIGISVPVASAPAHAARWVDGPCNDNVGITIVIDFHELGGGVNVRCAPGSATSGLDALDQAGIAWEGTRRFPGFVCRIAGLPDTAAEACNNTPPANAYWSYWLAPRGGTWCYSNIGPGNRVPPPGSVEGWSFSQGHIGSDIPPPGFAPPAPIAGQPPNPLKAGDCGAAAASPTPTPTIAPAAPTTAATATTTTAPATADPGPANTVAAEQPVDEAAAPTPASSVPPAGGAVVAAPSTTVAGASTTTSSARPTTSRPSTTTTAAVDDEQVSNATVDAVLTGSAVALGTVDLSDDGRGGGGFSPATGLGIVVAGGVGGGSIWVARRRRAVP